MVPVVALKNQLGTSPTLALPSFHPPHHASAAASKDDVTLTQLRFGSTNATLLDDNVAPITFIVAILFRLSPL